MADDQRRLEELLSGLVDDELTDEEAREARALVERDPEARALYERMRALAGAMRAETPPDPPPGLAARISTGLHESGGEVLVPGRRRWLGPAALTAAASVAAALLIGALLHDHWEVFAPRLDYRNAEQAEIAEGVRPEPEAEAKTEEAPEPGEARRAQEIQDELRSEQLDAAVRKEVLAATPPPLAERSAPARVDDLEAPREEQDEAPRAAATLEKPVTVGAGVASARDEIVEQETRGRQEFARRPAPKKGTPSCTKPWTSSTRVARAEGAPEDASSRLRRLVEGLGGSLEGDPVQALSIPAPGFARFVEALPETGHVFIGPTPVLPAGRDCLRLSLQM